MSWRRSRSLNTRLHVDPGALEPPRRPVHGGARPAPRERDAFVTREAGSDPELQAELRGMLAQASAGAGQIDRLIGDVARQAAPAPEWAGRRVGAYRIVREIGRGGMGLVFEAMRDDDEYRKRVALKIAPWWKDVALLNERFRLERQILADLDHPNIARFLDGGTDDGLPYVVMEYVDGVPITQHCAEKRLDLSQRLALFRQVCAAIQFAHQSLVVHRDLKPANILVDEAGAPKLLDFGIAKLLDPLVPGGETTIGAAMWTPDYASPEQIRGRPITTRSDVYQLGLVLYELLTGEKAQVADQSSALALDRSVCEVDPLPPSERLAAGDPSTGSGRPERSGRPRGRPSPARRSRHDRDDGAAEGAGPPLRVRHGAERRHRPPSRPGSRSSRKPAHSGTVPANSWDDIGSRCW